MVRVGLSRLLAILIVFIASPTCFAAGDDTTLSSVAPAAAVPAAAASADQQALPYPTPRYHGDSDREQVKRGEYLVKAGDCIACHTDTKNHGEPFSGGLGIKTPFGTFYTPNITADPQTGIGKWSDQDFIDAMHKGVSPQNKNYFPVFPYTHFALVTNDDLLAIKAYLFSIPTIYHEKRKDDVPFPFSWRMLQYGWKLMFFYPYPHHVYKEDPAQSVQWNRGAYLVEGLGHCAMCHSPHNIFGAEKDKYAYTGNFVDGYFAPDISAHGLADVSVDDVVNVFKKSEMLKGAGKVGGPMLEVNRDSLQYMTDSDLQAMVVYLKSVKSELPPSKTGGAITEDTGKDIYEDKCAICHTTGAAGAPKLGSAADWAPRVSRGMASLVDHAIHGYNSMPPMGTCMTCTTAEIQAVVTYMVDAEKGGGSGSATAVASVEPTAVTFAMGKRVYDKTCSVCHAEGKLGAPKFGDKAAWAPVLDNDMDVIFGRVLAGYKAMPPKGACYTCTTAEVLAAVKYMAQAGASNANYSLW